jgi:hypothetical protein
MKRITAFALSALCMSVLSFGAVGTWKGAISDKMCGADHNGKDPVACTRACVKGGSPYVLVVGKDKSFDIENQKDAAIADLLYKYAGRSVVVSGTETEDGKSLKIESIKPQ